MDDISSWVEEGSEVMIREERRGVENARHVGRRERMDARMVWLMFDVVARLQ